MDHPESADQWETVLAFLREAKISDVLQPGWIDRRGPAAILRPFSFDVYLESDRGYLQLTSVNSCGGLRIRVIPESEYLQELVEATDEELVSASLGQLYLGDGQTWQCLGMRLFVNDESDPKDGIFRAAELKFSSGTIFFDPFWIDGVRIGTDGTADVWLEEHRTERFITLFGPLRELHWSPTTSVNQPCR